MGVTTNYAIHYPTLSDPPNVPNDLQTAMTSVDTVLKSLADRIGTLEGTTASATTYQNVVLTTATLVMQSIPPNGWYAVNWDKEQRDLTNAHDLSTKLSQVRILNDGVYELHGFAGFAANNVGDRGVGFRNLATTTYPALHVSRTTSETGQEWFGSVSVVAEFKVGTTVEMVVRQTSAGNLKLSEVLPRFSIRQIAP